MLDTARDLFVSEGYPATTMERIAAQAGVAVQTLYYTFRTKAQMLCEVMEVTAAGETDPVPVDQRSWMTEAMTTPSAHRALALSIEHGTDIFERAAPLWPAIWAASAIDPYVEQYWQRVATARRAGMSQLAARLADLGALRDDITPARATDLLFRALQPRDVPWPGPAGGMDTARVQGMALRRPGPPTPPTRQSPPERYLGAILRHRAPRSVTRQRPGLVRRALSVDRLGAVGRPTPLPARTRERPSARERRRGADRRSEDRSAGRAT